MVSLKFRSFRVRPHPPSRRFTNGDNENTVPRGIGDDGHQVTGGKQGEDQKEGAVDGKGDVHDKKAASKPRDSNTLAISSPPPQPSKIPSMAPGAAAATTAPEDASRPALPAVILQPTMLTSIVPTTVLVALSGTPTTPGRAATGTPNALTDTAPSELAPAPPPTALFRAGELCDSGDCRDQGSPAPPPSNEKLAIALAVIAGLGLLVGLLSLTFFIARWRKRRGKNTRSMSEYERGICTTKTLDLRWLARPFGRHRRAAPEPTQPSARPSRSTRRSYASIMDDAMRATYAADEATPRGPGEKQQQQQQHGREPAAARATSPAGGPPGRRKSIAAWLRGSRSSSSSSSSSSSHIHPLAQNAASSRGSRPPTRPGRRHRSRAAAAHTDADAAPADEPSPPPMPDLALQRSYSVASPAALATTTTTPDSRSAGLVAEAASHAYDPPATPATPDTDRGGYSGLSQAPGLGGGRGHARMSSVYSNATQSTLSAGERDSFAGATVLRPPAFQRSVPSGEPGSELTTMQEELLDLYRQGLAGPPSAVGRQ